MTGKNVKIAVPSEGGDKKDEEKAGEKVSALENTEKKVDLLSEEDEKLKKELEEMVAVLLDSQISSTSSTSQLKSLKKLRQEIQLATTSMTSVPKPLKFLSPFYSDLCDKYEQTFKHTNESSDVGCEFADLLSMLSMTMAKDADSRLCLSYKLKGGNYENVGKWGHEYVRHLAGEIGSEYNAQLAIQSSSSADDEQKKEKVPGILHQLNDLVDVIVPFHIQHNAEPEAIDILLEVNQLNKILPYVKKSDPKQKEQQAKSAKLIKSKDLKDEVEVEKEAKIDEENYERICLYLLSCASYCADEEDLDSCLLTSYQIYVAMEQYPQALRVALRMDNLERVSELFSFAQSSKESQNVTMQQQMALILARHRLYFDELELPENEIMVENEELNDVLENLVSNNRLHFDFMDLVRDLDCMEAKTPEDIYKSHLSETGSVARSSSSSNANVDSAKHNLASTFVNAFVNVGFGNDTLILAPEKKEGETGNSNSNQNSSSWIYKNKAMGMMSATASIGMLMQWNSDEGLTQIDKFLYSGEDYIKAGALFGVGLLSTGVKSECDPAFAVLSEYLMQEEEEKKKPNKLITNSALLALGVAYVGSNRSDLMEILTGVLSNDGEEDSYEFSSVCYAALSLGLIAIGSCNEEATFAIVQRLMECNEAELMHQSNYLRFMVLGLGLLFLGHQEKCEGVLAAVETIAVDKKAIQLYISTVVNVCAYANSGNVLKVQEMLHICALHFKDNEEEEEDENNDNEEKHEEETKEGGVDEKSSLENKPVENLDYQSVAVIGISLITMGESVGKAMAIRTFDHLLQYGDLAVRRVLPLALALLNLSSPEYSLIDSLSRLSHDTDSKTAQAAIFSLGLISAGTNNSRVAGLLRQLSEFYNREPNLLFITRIAQGLLHMGKGLMGINPFHSDNFLLNKVALGGILTVLTAAMDMDNVLLGGSSDSSSSMEEQHFLLYFLSPAIHPRMLVTVDEQLKLLPVSVRVGQAVEVVGQAGKPKSITGFQTHTSPVLLPVTDRAELATNEYIASTNVLEGIVILTKNPDYNPAD